MVEQSSLPGATPDAWSRIRHQLRTPLNAILGYSEMLIEDAVLLPEGAGCVGELQKIHEAGSLALHFVNEGLSQGRQETERDDFGALAEHVRRTLQPPIDEVFDRSRRLLDGAGAAAYGEGFVPDLERIRDA
ncbi:MAG: hypothetical protein EXR72_10175 [Myxococcales bacterium]|nr:hypothetical protein [Myxococcales bacterium]